MSAIPALIFIVAIGVSIETLTNFVYRSRGRNLFSIVNCVVAWGVFAYSLIAW